VSLEIARLFSPSESKLGTRLKLVGGARKAQAGTNLGTVPATVSPPRAATLGWERDQEFSLLRENLNSPKLDYSFDTGATYV